jgi:TetR/AcrR family transcriptional regulator, transcriptional repressor of aconitase
VSSAVERDAARRREILEAAKTCFLRFGYSKTSLDDIAKTAKLSRPLLYRKFPNKGAIFAALYDDVFETQLQCARESLARSGATAHKLERICQIVCVEPYELINRAPMAQEFWEACEQLIPEILERHKRKWRALLGKLLAKPLVEVFDLALDGLYADTPTVAVFRQRIGVLIARFT